MSRIPSSLNNVDTAVNRNIDKSNFDNIKLVAQNIIPIGSLGNAIRDNNNLVDNMATVSNVNNLTSITNVGQNIESVKVVDFNTGYIQTVGGNINNVISVATNITDVNSVANSIDNVKYIADNMYDVNTVANLDMSVLSTVYDNIDNISIDASNIGNINIVAEDLNAAGITNTYDAGSIADEVIFTPAGQSLIRSVSDNMGNLNQIVTQVIPSITEILLTNDNATIATNKASEASASATSASNSATTATTQATLATTKANEASTSATASATSASQASASATTASTQASIAATQATTATNQASIATAQANNASTSANNALTSEQNAANHLAAIEVIYDNFDDRYLGVYATDPVLDNEGNPLIIGTIYFNSVTNDVKFYNGTSWENPELTSTQAANDALNYMNNAQTYATNSQNSATASANSASSSSMYATNAQTSANSALSSATLASQKATDTANLLATFQGQYTSGSVAPSSPDIGDLWFNTTLEGMNVYTSTGWEAAYASSSGALINVNNLSDVSNVTTARNNLNAQQTLVSGTNIKTINNFSILGSGNVNVSAGSGGYAANVYLTTLTSTTNASYKQISYSPEASETIISAVVNNNNTVTMATYIFDGDVRANLIPAGKWGFNYSARVDNTAGDTIITFEIFKRSNTGVETVLFTLDTATIESISFVSSELLSILPSYTVVTTDRLGLRIKISTTRTSNTTVYLKIGGREACYFNTPLEVRHNQLRARDEVDSHPITAITDLSSELSNRYTKVETDTLLADKVSLTGNFILDLGGL